MNPYAISESELRKERKRTSALLKEEIRRGEIMKEYQITISNRMRVTVEARNETAAENKLRKIIDKDYDFPYNEADDYDGWQIEDVEEVD